MEIRSLAAGRLNSILRQQLIIVASWRCDNLLPTQRIYYMCSRSDAAKKQSTQTRDFATIALFNSNKNGRSFDVELQISKDVCAQRSEVQ
jgi:hypothetical protein